MTDKNLSDKKLEDEIEYEIVEQDAEENEVAEKPQKPKAKDDGDEDRLAASSADEDGEDGDEGDDTEAKRAERRERKRLQRQKRKEFRERDKAVISTLEQQNQMLAQRLAAVEGRTFQRDAQDLDARLGQAVEQYNYAERLIRDAVAKGDGETVTRAMRARDEAALKARELQSVRSRMSAPQQAAPQAPDPRVINNAKEWIEDHPWYDPNGGDDDSAIVLAIDNRLAEEGYNPATQEYWDELRDRVESKLPHKFQKAATRKTPPVGSSRERSPGANKIQVRIDADRKKALIEAGAWEDPVKRAKFLKSFAEYDRANPKTR